MVAQIIVSREDSTSFFSLGSVQDDASLVSALGGALASFAVEMGLSDIGTSNANYPKFQNGVLISKWLEIGNYRPSLMIAIRNFDNLEQYHHIFLLDYGTILAKRVILKFDKLYSSSGEIPRFDDVLKYIPEIVYELYKDSPNTLKEFTSTLDESINKYFVELWENQSDKGMCPFGFRNLQYSPDKITQIIGDFVQYFYREGTINDALFPLYFSSSPDLKAVNKKIIDFLNSKAKSSTEEITEEIKRITNHLGEMSSSRTRRKKKIEIESVDLLNADLIFENIAIAPVEQLDKTRTKILDELYNTLLLKLYQLYPLKYLAASIIKPIDISFIQEIVEKSIEPIIKETLANTERISTQISSILREITSDYTPEEALKNKDEILSKVHERFIKQIKKDDPFIILSDPGLERTLKLVNRLASEAFEQYRTAHDEAMALWYIVRQINSSISKLKTTSINSIVQIQFLQELIRKYQFRTIPDIVFRISTKILEEVVSSPSSKSTINTLLEKNISAFEKQVQFSIPVAIKNSIIKRFKTITTVKPTTENIETLSFFSRAFSLAMESSIVFILEMFFGKNNFPHPPEQLSEAIEKLVLNSQGLYSFSKIMHVLSSYSSAQELFSSETENILVKALGYSNVLPSPIELMKIAYDYDWITDYKDTKETSTKISPKTSQISKKDSSEIKDTIFLAKKVTIPSLKISDQVSSLIQDPLVVTELWILYGERAFHKRLENVRKYMKTLESKQKTSAGATNGKKRVESNLRKAKTVSKTLQKYIVGGKLFQRIFSSKKGLKYLISNASKERFPGLNYFPENFTINTDEGIIYGRALSRTSFSILGGFQKLTEIYASTWVRDSEYIRKLKEEILWRVLEKKSQKSTLENKILENLQLEAAKSGRVNQETIVRNTIEHEVSLHYRKIVRETINLAFDSIKDDLIVRTDNSTKDNYLVIDTFDIDKKYLGADYDQLRFMKLVKIASDKTELRLNLTELIPTISSRKKTVQTMRLFIRDGLKEIFKSKQFKALSILGELVDAYIGEQAVDLFFSKSSVFEQLILESIDKS
ncbi:MAG: hypothetical protein ACFFDW_03705 [Candidatus Thorarchaeota archaeon]